MEVIHDQYDGKTNYKCIAKLQHEVSIIHSPYDIQHCMEYDSSELRVSDSMLAYQDWCIGLMKRNKLIKVSGKTFETS